MPNYISHIPRTYTETIANITDTSLHFVCFADNRNMAPQQFYNAKLKNI